MRGLWKSEGYSIKTEKGELRIMLLGATLGLGAALKIGV